MDPCETDFDYRLACCECDIATCNPPAAGECGPPPEPPPQRAASGCMSCHNGSDKDDYAGAGMSNPHPFLNSGYIACENCHGGNRDATSKIDAHVPPPPEIGDRLQLQNDPKAYFNRLTLTGIDKFPPYTVDGVEYTALEYLQFINPGDIRVVSTGESCGTSGCHSEHAESVSRYPIATETGFYSAPTYSIGKPNLPDRANWYQGTASEYGFRSVEDPNFTYNPSNVGAVPYLQEYPENAVYGDRSGVYQNPLYDANNLDDYQYNDNVGDHYVNQVVPGTPLETLVMEQIAITCGDCHLGSAGANNRFADFRSSGCTACHMQYSMDGRSRSTDPNVNKLEPADPDAIAAPERSHIDSHQIRNVAKILPNGGFLRGVTDNACVGCHQGSNRTVLQFWGVRLDQNQDVVNNFQYPANPVNFQNTAADTRLFDPAVANNTFNGRNNNQYLGYEDYDGDNRDDIPADIHYERGMGCIDCHGSPDVHGTDNSIKSREDQAMAIECTSCHGTVDGPPPTVECTNYEGQSTYCAVDRNGNAVRNVTIDGNGDFWLRSRVDGQRHYVPITVDTVVQNNKRHPITSQLIYTPAASYAMGRADGNLNTGIGPQQQDPNLISPGFSHMDNMECISCHASWSNNCIGCHLGTGYNDNPNDYFFSNTTGERIVLFQAAADFTYITPIPMTIAVGSRNKITQMTPGMKMFYRYDADFNNNTSNVYGFTDRNGNGNNPQYNGSGVFGALAHNKIMPHTVRGRVDAQNEGPRYCVSCHLNVDSYNNFAAEYQAHFDALEAGDVANVDFNLLQAEIGQNTGNQNNSPFFVHMAVGLGSGLFYFDDIGCPLNPLDNNANRFYCDNQAPADRFDPNNAVYNLDRTVEITGRANASNGHPMLDGQGSQLRDGAQYTNLAGPLGSNLLRKLAHPDPNQSLILDSWVDADGQAQGGAAAFYQ